VSSIPLSRILPLFALLALIGLGAGLSPASAQTTTDLPFTIRGFVLDHEIGGGVGGVLVSLMDAEGERQAAAITNSRGEFAITHAAAGRYFLSLTHLGYAEHRSEWIDVEQGETIQVDIRLRQAAIALDAITVVGRRDANRHDATHAGLYLRIPRFPAQVGSNRILVKGDPELMSVLSVSDLLDQYFPRVARTIQTPSGCLYWNGFLVNPLQAEARLAISTSDLEGVEVYGDYMMAPLNMMGPPHDFLQSTCSAVVALWPLRPDLPGRTEPRE
jgi:hypothetical protein